MPSRILTLTPDDPRPDRIDPAVQILRDGGLVCLPTDTFYGIAADALNPEALRRVNALKGKPAGSPILLLLADRTQASRVAETGVEAFDALAEMFWPGPLSLVVPARPGLPPEISGPRGTVALRVPGLAVARRVAAELGNPISGVSANPTGHPPCRTALDVCVAFPSGVDMILDGGSTTGGAPSTIIDLSGPEPQVLREGAVPVSALRPYLSTIRKIHV